MDGFTQESLFPVSEFEKLGAIAVIEEDLQGEEDPAYITPKHHDHDWRPYMRTDVEMTWVCNCGETKTELSAAEYSELWAHHSDNMRLALEGAIASTTAELVQHYWQRVSIEKVILDYIVGNLPAFMSAPKTFDNTPKIVIETEPEKSRNDGLNRYQCKGSTNKYWRYSYRVNSRVKHLHIKGGNERAPLVKKRVAKIQEMINRGSAHQEIISVIKGWS